MLTKHSLTPRLRRGSGVKCSETIHTRVVHDDLEINLEDVAGPVIGKKFALQDCRLLKSRAGDPATIPSKSAGNISEAFIP